MADEQAKADTPRSRAKRDQIRRGGLDAFLRLGFAAASTDRIAAEAGVSKQTLYAYYRTKEALLLDVLTEFVHRVGDTAAAEPPVATREELRAALRHLAGDVIDALTRPEYLALVRIILNEGARLPEVGGLWARTVPGRIRSAAAELLGRAQAAGVVGAGVPVDAAVRLFTGGLLTYVLPDGLLAADPREVAPSGGEIDELIELHLTAICGEEK